MKYGSDVGLGHPPALLKAASTSNIVQRLVMYWVAFEQGGNESGPDGM